MPTNQKLKSRSLDLSIGVSSYVLRDMPCCLDTGTVVSDSKTSPFSFTWQNRLDNDIDILMLLLSLKFRLTEKSLNGLPISWCKVEFESAPPAS